MKIKFLPLLLVISAVLFAAGCKTEQAGDKVCNLEVECLEVLENKAQLNAEKTDFIPDDGYIKKSGDVYFSDGESVMDVVLRELKRKKIHFDKSGNYISGINNLYAGDCGEMSGWVYTVNGESPTVDMASYKLKEGDQIVIKFICSWE